jgi:hypothetical protein
MDNNARSHRARIVNQYKQQEAIDTITWPAMSSDMNPIEHVWDYIGQRLNHRNSQCQNLAELRTAMVEEWQHFPQYKLRRLVHSMKRSVRELFRKRGNNDISQYGIAIHLSVHNAIENIKVQLASERKATPHSYTARKECTCWKDVVFIVSSVFCLQTRMRPSTGRKKNRLSSDQ